MQFVGYFDQCFFSPVIFFAVKKQGKNAKNFKILKKVRENKVNAREVFLCACDSVKFPCQKFPKSARDHEKCPWQFWNRKVSRAWKSFTRKKILTWTGGWWIIQWLDVKENFGFRIDVDQRPDLLEDKLRSASNYHNLSMLWLFETKYS